MNTITLFIAICLAVSTSAFFLKPSVYQPSSANNTICQSNFKDSSNSAQLGVRSPYLRCPNNGKLRIFSCLLQLATPDSCPLNFVNNAPRELYTGEVLINQNCTTALKTLCDYQAECSFTWNQLPELKGYTPKQNAQPISLNDQSAIVKFFCDDKRKEVRPFSNKRYDSKFHPNVKHSLRKLSYNRLPQL